ncbi:MAG: S49 family peptidase [Patescibacteria group bacterium]
MKTLRQEIVTILLWVAAILIVFALGLQIFGSWYDEWSGFNGSFLLSDGYCNIAVIPIVGDIVAYNGASGYVGEDAPITTSAGDVRATVQAAQDDPNIRGIFAPIDSYGGTPVASEVIANLFKASSMPIAALIGEVGTSGAYLAATGADVIFASPFSDIGSIGMTMSYLDNTEQNAENGIRYISLVSAQFKDYGTPDKSLTAAERALLERDLKIYHEQFVKEVAENRNLPVEEVAKIADGSSMPASLALENKLIDALGNEETVRAWFAEQLKMPIVEVVFCE